MVAATGSCFEFLFFFHFNFCVFNAFSRTGFARHFFLEFVGCCHSRLLVGSSAFMTDRGFLWPFLDLVGGLCSCVLMLIHALICVLFLVYAGCCRLPGRGINTGLSVFCFVAPWLVIAAVLGLWFVGLLGSGSLRPGVHRLPRVCLFHLCFPSGCHRLAHHRTRSHRAVCGRWLWHSPDVRCWRCGCQCVHLLLRGWHRPEWGHSPAVLHRRGHWRPAGCSHLPFLAGWLCLVLLPRCSVLLRGFGAAWSSVLEARACRGCGAFLCVSLLVDRVLASLLFFRPGPGASLVAAVPGKIKVRGLHGSHFKKTYGVSYFASLF